MGPRTVEPDRDQPGMGAGAADNGGVQAPGGGEIVHEPAAARKQPRGFVPEDAGGGGRPTDGSGRSAPARSSWARHAATEGWARARSSRTATSRAWARELRTMAACRPPAAGRSSTNRPRPASSRGSSCLRTAAPTYLPLIRPGGGGGRVPRPRSPLRQAGGGPGVEAPPAGGETHDPQGERPPRRAAGG